MKNTLKIGDIVYDDRREFNDYAVVTKIEYYEWGNMIFGVWGKTKKLAIKRYKEYINSEKGLHLNTDSRYLTKVGEYKEKITNWRKRIK